MVIVFFYLCFIIDLIVYESEEMKWRYYKIWFLFTKDGDSLSGTRDFQVQRSGRLKGNGTEPLTIKKDRLRRGLAGVCVFFC